MAFLAAISWRYLPALTIEFLDEPVHLVALDNLITAGKEGSEIPKYKHTTFVEHDVIKSFNFEGTLDYVIHAAGIASPFYYRAYPLETLEVAITGTRNMLELAERSDARVSFFRPVKSTVIRIPNMYRWPRVTAVMSRCRDQGHAMTRASVSVKRFAIFSTLRKVLRRILYARSTYYGPGMQETDYRVLPNFANRIKGGLPLNIYGAGTQTRTFCYITDAMVGFLLVILKGVPGEAYNIGNPTPEISMVELVETIREVTSAKVEFNLIEYPDSYPADEPMRRSPDIRKARLQLDFKPEVDLKVGLKRFFGWSDQIYTGQQ